MSDDGKASLKKQESSVRHLQVLYTIVAGLALSDAVQELAADIEHLDRDGRVRRIAERDGRSRREPDPS